MASHTHSHACDHSSGGHANGFDGHPLPKSQRNNLVVLRNIAILTTAYLIIELVGGFLSGSLALLSDAGHMFCDLCAVLLAIFAAWLAQKPHNPQKTYGYYRAEILAAFVNGILLAFIAVAIFFEALQRFNQPHEVNAPIAMGVALGGLIVNGIAFFMIGDDHGHHHHNANLKAVWVHIVSDALGSLGALLAAVAIYFGFNSQIDAWVSLLIVGLIVFNAWGLIQKTTNILLEGVPQHLDTEAIRQAILEDTRLVAVHDLHVWSIDHQQDALSAHVVLKSSSDFSTDVLKQIHLQVQQRFNIFHITIQLECPAFDLEEHVHR